jgi:hypothetical protein
MKLYTEEQVITIVIELLWNIKTNNNDTFYNRETIKDSLVLVQEKLKNYKLDITPIELPSDEEINEKANSLQDENDGDLYNEGINEGFYLGVEYMQQQILNQNK